MIYPYMLKEQPSGERNDNSLGQGYYIPRTFTPTCLPEPIEFINNTWYGLFSEHQCLWTRASSAIPQCCNDYSLGFWDIGEPEHPDYQGPVENYISTTNRCKHP